jgi:hypothetical protein
LTLPELFANTPTPGVPGPITRLSAAADPSDTTIATADPAPATLQATGQFRILVEAEYMLVTGGAATTTWTVSRGIEGSVAAGHAAGVDVNHLLTAGALSSIAETAARYGSAGTFVAPQTIQSDTTTPFTVTTTTGNNAVAAIVNAYGNGLLVNQTFDHSAANEGPRDSMGVYHKSTGDGLFIGHAGGEPPGYSAVAGGDAGVNVLIPKYLDDIGSGWAGTIVNNRTNMKGLFIQAQPNNINVSAAILLSWTNSPCLIITNQDPSHPPGGGSALYIEDWGGGSGANSMLTTGLASANNAIAYTTVRPHGSAYSTTVAYVDPGAPNAALAVSVARGNITVSLATDASGARISTAAAVIAAIAASPAAAALVTAANAGRSDGSGLVAPMGHTLFSGGSPTGNPTVVFSRNAGGGTAQPFLQLLNRTGATFYAITLGDPSQVRWRLDTAGLMQWVEPSGAVYSSLQRTSPGVLGLAGALALTAANGATPRTGLGGVSTDYLTFYTAGAERLRISPGGAVSTNGASAFGGVAFQVSQSAAGVASSLVLQNTHQADGDGAMLAMSDAVRHFAVVQGVFTRSADAGALSLQVRRGSSLVERVRLDQSGIGLYGVPPVPRAPKISSPSSDTVGTKAAIDAIRTALTNLGVTL